MFLLILIVVAYSEEQCPVRIVEGYLKRYCEAEETFQCISSDHTYISFKTFTYRRLNYALDSACSDENNWYQACGIPRALGYTGVLTTEVQSSAPFCGYLCSHGGYQVVQDYPCIGVNSTESTIAIEVHGVSVTF